MLAVLATLPFVPVLFYLCLGPELRRRFRRPRPADVHPLYGYERRGEHIRIPYRRFKR